MLRERGLKLALCSNLADPYAAPILAQLGLPLDCYAWSFQVGAIKPDPRIYAYVLRQLGCTAEEVLFVGDSVEADLAGPASIGMRVQLIQRQPFRHKLSAPVIMNLASLAAVLALD